MLPPSDLSKKTQYVLVVGQVHNHDLSFNINTSVKKKQTNKQINQRGMVFVVDVTDLVCCS